MSDDVTSSALSDEGVCPFEIERPIMMHRWERLTFLHWSADDRGVATATITIPRGPLENIKPPASSCGPDNPCAINVITLIGDGPDITVRSFPLEYVG
jgi:hypothetical protein